MANLGETYDPSQHDALGDRSPLPAGWYAVQIQQDEICDVKPPKEGRYLKLTLELLEQHHPQHKGRMLWENLNLWNPNQDAVRIANQTIKSICEAVGHTGAIQNTDVLHGKPFAVKLKIKDDRVHGPQNQISAIAPLAKHFGPGAAPQQEQRLRGSDGSSMPPWATKGT